MHRSGACHFNNHLNFIGMGKNLFIDAEWFLSQQVYLIGYAYNLNSCNQLYEVTINRGAFLSLLHGVDTIYCYGPDVGMLEKFFDIDLKSNYYCFNLIGIFKKLEPHLKSYKLAELEKSIGIKRETMQYKTNIWRLHKDWQNPRYRHLALQYNRDDVVNLIRVKNYFFQTHGITRKDILEYRMK